jgi:Rrf2 family protein
MRFTAQEEYGLRCMMQMARRAPRVVSIHEIAEAESLTPHYVGKIMRVLRKGRLVGSVRGKKGGYRMLLPAREVPVGAVLDALGGKFFEAEYCERFTGTEHFCARTPDCALRSLWRSLESAMSGILTRTTLADLVGMHEGAMDARLAALAPPENGVKAA